MQKQYYRVLTIAGSDSGGGAGVQADLKTFSALQCIGMTVITALTAQNSLGVQGIHKVPPEFVKAQLDSVLSDFGADAVKIGMLHSVDVIKTVAETLTKYPIKNIILDPVMYAKNGDLLIEDLAVEALKVHLIPLARVLTPNILEASKILKRNINTLKKMEKAVKELSGFGPEVVILKGGHFGGKNSDDCLLFKNMNQKEEIIWLRQRRIKTLNVHGTGCTFSSALTALIARSFPLVEAVMEAKKFITGALDASRHWKIGAGHGPVHHFYRIWK